MTEAEKRVRRCCFTGHRPEKLTSPEQEILVALEKEIRQTIADGLTEFISGMARGTDIWAAEIVLRLREEDQAIRLICASPYEGFERNWKADWQKRYRAILESADCVHFICPGYNRSCFQARNKWMVNRASKVIAVFNGGKGGTRNTIKYANRMGIPVVIIKG